MIEFRALGVVDLRRRDGPELLSILSQPKRTALLAYLILARPHGFHRRDRLVALFWPEADAEHGRNSLRQSVHFLRRSLGEDVVASRGEEELGVGAGIVWCDAQAFEEGLDRGDADAALKLYRGELLPGFFVEGAPEFERWLEAERSRLHGRAVRAASELAQARERAGDAAGAAEVGARALALAPDDEGLLRAQMQRLARLGERAAALAAYDRCAERLQEDYELEPDPETRALAEEIRARSTLMPAPAAPTGAPGAALPPVPVTIQATTAPSVLVVDAALARPSGAPPDQGLAPLPEQPLPPVAGPWPRRRSIRRPGLLAVGIMLALCGGALGVWLVLRGRQPVVNPRGVVVSAFENQTGDTTLAPLSNMAADWIMDGLAKTGIVEVADAPTVLSVHQAGLRAGGTGAEMVRLLSHETDAGLVVTGRYYRHADSLAFVAQVVDARTGRIVRAVSPVTTPATLPVAGAERLRQRLMAELAVLLDERLAHFQALERDPPSYAAYREYMDGLAGYIEYDTSAVDHFERAYALDTTFYRAALWAAQSMWGGASEGQSLERWDSLLARAERLRPFFTPAEQYQLDHARAMRAGNFRAAYAAARRRLEASPGSDAALREVAFGAFRINHLREASALFARPEWKRGLLRLNYSDYMALVTFTQHMRGDFAGQLRSTAEWARREPGLPNPEESRMEALAALGRVDEVRSLALRLADRMLGTRDNPAQPFVYAAQELAAHARPADVLTLARLGLTRCELAAPSPDQPRSQSDSRQDPVDIQAWRLHCAELLGLLGRWREAAALIPRADTSSSLRLSYLTAAGVAAARLGDTATAVAFSDSIARSPVRTRGEKWRAQFIEFDRALIAAALGDREDALRRLRLWRAAGSSYPFVMHIQPVLMPYFSDPRFRQLLESED